MSTRRRTWPRKPCSRPDATPNKLRDPEGRDRWLSAIARNVCRRWAREHGRALPRLARLDESCDGGDDFVEEPADDFDVEVELERHELAELLDRALGFLPATTCRVLVARYVHDPPHAEIAAQLGLSADAVSMRLTHGKLLLHHALATALREEATAYGFCDPATDCWQQSRIWRPECGRHRLLARFPRPPGTVSFRCPACHPEMTGSDYGLTARAPCGATRPGFLRLHPRVRGPHRRRLAVGLAAGRRQQHRRRRMSVSRW